MRIFGLCTAVESEIETIIHFENFLSPCVSQIIKTNYQ